MAENTFLTYPPIASILSQTRTWFANEWPNICSSNLTLPSPFASGTLDPLLSEGTSTVGNCRISCGTARIIQLSGLSGVTISNATVRALFKTCDRQWLVIVSMALDVPALSAEVTYYGMSQSSVSQGVAQPLTVTGAAGNLVLEIPTDGTNFFFEDVNVLMNMAIFFGDLTLPDLQVNSYVNSALDAQTDQFIGALRNTLDAMNFTSSYKKTLGANTLVPITIPGFVIPPFVPQGCTLTGPCHPCDNCCICTSTQVCTDNCLNCPCINCNASIGFREIVFVVCVFVLLMVYLRRIIINKSFTK